MLEWFPNLITSCHTKWNARVILKLDIRLRVMFEWFPNLISHHTKGNWLWDQGQCWNHSQTQCWNHSQTWSPVITPRAIDHIRSRAMLESFPNLTIRPSWNHFTGYFKSEFCCSDPDHQSHGQRWNHSHSCSTYSCSHIMRILLLIRILITRILVNARVIFKLLLIAFLLQGILLEVHGSCRNGRSSTATFSPWAFSYTVHGVVTLILWIIQVWNRAAEVEDERGRSSQSRVRFCFTACLFDVMQSIVRQETVTGVLEDLWEAWVAAPGRYPTLAATVSFQQLINLIELRIQDLQGATEQNVCCKVVQQNKSVVI